MRQPPYITASVSDSEERYWRLLGLDVPRILTKEETSKLIEQTLEFSSNVGQTTVQVRSWWRGELRWARNRVTLASDRKNIEVAIRRCIDGVSASTTTNQTDDISLQSAVQRAERNAAFIRKDLRMQGPEFLPPAKQVPETKIWSDTTFNVAAAERGEVANKLTTDAETKKMLSAGYLEMLAGIEMAVGPGRSGEKIRAGWTVIPPVYRKFSLAQCSMTVRHPQGTGSGWAGLSSYDWSSIDGIALAGRALDKCLASLNPVAIEPGRYTAILEPQAVCNMLDMMVDTAAFSRERAEIGDGPFALGFDAGIGKRRTKLGLQVMDRRITLRHDPQNPVLGTLTSPGAIARVYVKNGILTGLSYDRDYAVQSLTEDNGLFGGDGLFMESGDSSLDEMIATTKRGLLITRFSHIRILDYTSVLGTGLTRDGLWLIENGTISKAVKNMRFVESPLFILNQVEAIGEAVPVFNLPRIDGTGPAPRVVPPIKVNDFSFTALNDAI